MTDETKTQQPNSGGSRCTDTIVSVQFSIDDLICIWIALIAKKPSLKEIKRAYKNIKTGMKNCDGITEREFQKKVDEIYSREMLYRPKHIEEK
ncbi:MAG: hypothetical protein PHN44_08705 [Candidatus Marinimicrobia bacterium]|nr:hypothetical protein [Candidatus Neomarinimicrobiota bacterium]